MSSSINTAVLRTLTLGELPSELQTLRLKAADESITQQLLDAVERGSISTSVFGIWIGISKSPFTIQQSLKQKISVQIRHLGIKQLKSGLETPLWEQLWEGLGGTAGVLEIFSDLSVVEVKAACKAIGRSTSDGDLPRGDTDLTRKRERVTELFKGLHPDIFPDAQVKSRDLRPLTKYYQILVPSCTAELVDWISSAEQEGKWQFVKERELLKHHSETIGKAALRTVFESQSPDSKSKDRLRKLSRQFPTFSSSKHDFSASMLFALSLLRKVVETDTKEVENEWVIGNLIRPLLSRAVRKRVAWSRIQEIVMLAMQFFEHHPQAKKILKNSKGGVVHMVALCWSRRSVLFEAQLKRLLGIVFVKKTSFEDLADILVGVPRSRRYALLRLCCQEVMGVDLESEGDLSKAQGVLPYSTLYGMEASQALSLFKRLRRARGDANLVSLGPYNSVLATRRTPSVYEGDPDINYLVLLNRNGMHKEAEAYAADILDVRKKVTQTSASRETRAENALFTWAYANASGSLSLLRETLQWAKRFVRDQLTASSLFSSYYDETYQLLSGFLVHGNSALKSQDLRLRVEAANTFMTDMLDTACLGLREPFFRASDWRNAIDLFTRTTKQRIEISAKMKKEMGASDEDMYYTLWEDTIAMLLRVEKLVNREEYEKLGAATISGVVMWDAVFPRATYGKAGLLEKSTWRFIDALAEARNRLWSELRPARYPDVLTLPAPFPRGLPVQHLFAHRTPHVLDLDQFAPYLSSRVQQTLFAIPETALKPVATDKRLMTAIGCFVDSYHYALTAYIPQDLDKQEKRSRFLKVWDHAIGPLSVSRMNVQEAIRFWKRYVPFYLQNTLSEILPEEESVSWQPTIPESNDPSQTQEWNPLEGRPADMKIKERRLSQTTYIDFCTAGRQAQQTKPGLGSFYAAPESFIPMHHRAAPGIWVSSEAFNLAALLYLDAKYGTADRLLTAPFPSLSDVRFPCLFLDEEFLSLDQVKSSDAISYVTRNLAKVPLLLVRKITATIVGQLGTKNGSESLENAALSLLQALAESDRPGLAFDLVIKVIMERPDASSWHRILFNNGFLQRIPASDAKICISAYAKAIGERLDSLESNRKTGTKAEQNKAIDIDVVSPAPEEAVWRSQKPVIKVTTLKSLAQLLHRSVYIGDDVSLEILLDLSKKAKHIDVRVSILKTLLSKLEVNRPELWNRVLPALEAFLPLAGSLNEREPGSHVSLDQKGFSSSVRETGDPSEPSSLESNGASTSDINMSEPLRPFSQQYRRGSGLEARREMRADEPRTIQSGNRLQNLKAMMKAITTGLKREQIAMPAMQVTATYMWQAESPILGALVNHFVKLDGGQLSQLYMERIMIPLIDSLAEQTDKWTTLFLVKYAPEGFDILKTHLPSIPKGVQIFDEILSKPASKLDYIPRQILDQLLEYLVFKINPPAWIRALNQRLENDPALKSLSEVETWLTLYGTDLNQSWSKPSSMLPFHRVSNFSADNIEGDSNHITRRAYKHAFVKVFKELLWADSPGYDQLSALVSTVYVGGPNDDGGATIEDMIAYVNSLRTRDWERDPNRTPAVLPETFEWRLKLLAYPNHNASDSDEAREISSTNLAQQLEAILDEISGFVYHKKLQRIKEQSRGKQNAVLTALHLGDISKTRPSGITTTELLRVCLAAEMMLQSKGCDIGALEVRVKELLDSWIASESEEVRRDGYSVRGHLFDANGDWIQTT